MKSPPLLTARRGTGSNFPQASVENDSASESLERPLRVAKTDPHLTGRRKTETSTFRGPRRRM